MSYQQMKAEEVRKKSIDLMVKYRVPGLVATYTENKKRSSLLFAHGGMTPEECLVLLEDLRAGLEAFIEKQKGGAPG